MTENTQWYSDETATLGDRLVAARRHSGLTTQQLATQLGVDNDVVLAWESDQREPRANRLQMMTGLFGVSLGWLLMGEGDGPQGEVTQASNLQAASSNEDIRQELAKMRNAIKTLYSHLEQLEAQLLPSQGND